MESFFHSSAYACYSVSMTSPSWHSLPRKDGAMYFFHWLWPSIWDYIKMFKSCPRCSLFWSKEGDKEWWIRNVNSRTVMTSHYLSPAMNFTSVSWVWKRTVTITNCIQKTRHTSQTIHLLGRGNVTIKLTLNWPNWSDTRTSHYPSREFVIQNL